MKVGQLVYVFRKIGKNGKLEKSKGTIESFSKNILVKGKPTAVIKFSDKESYWYPLDEILPAL